MALINDYESKFHERKTSKKNEGLWDEVASYMRNKKHLIVGVTVGRRGVR